MICDMNNPLWVERYRPKTLDDVILPLRIKNQFSEMLKTGQIPNTMFVGGAGVGKTTVARALCEQLGLDWIIINGSSNNGIDTVRTLITDFASTTSLSGKGKCIIVDEADNLTADAQKALRAAIEEFSINCTFIFTCNYPSRLISAIHSRLPKYTFDVTEDEKSSMMVMLFKRITEILKNENVAFDKTTLVTLINKFYPDIRILLGYLQEFSRKGEITADVLSFIQDLDIDVLIKAIKTKAFKDIRQWCANNSDNDLSLLYGKLYKALIPLLVPESIPELILIINDYQRFDSVVPDKEVHLTAMAVQTMMQVKFK